tara:strand:+ start:3289 stop:3486 length:198 start_codon:yes stop_codon:yes gene_type:complete
MAKTKRRYCQECEKETLHDKFTDHIHGEQFSSVGRLFWGAVTIGVSELGAERYWVCQQCDTHTKR